LPEDARQQLLLCTQTEEIAREYKAILGTKPTPLPYYLDAPPPRRLASDRDQRTGLLVSYLGGARWERGFEMLPSIISSCLAADPTLRFFVQINEHAGRARDARLISGDDRVSTHTGTMNADAYLTAMQEADLLLLPLDPAHYRTQSSGVYWQASMAGTPVVVPAGTWMAERVRAHGHGVSFASSSPESIAAAIHEARSEIATLRANARRYAEMLRGEHGTAAFVDAVARLSSQPTAE